MSFWDILLWFYFYSFFGWFYESMLYTINQKKKEAQNVIHVTEDSIQMASSTCDNQLCVTEGVVTLENKASRVLGNYIICLPNGVTLELLNEEEYAALQQGQR